MAPTYSRRELVKRATLLAAGLGAADVLAACSAPPTTTAPAPEGPGAPRATPVSTPAPNARSPLGMNVSDQTYYATQIPFVDVMKQAAPWIPTTVAPGPWDTGAKLALTPDGWPASLDPGQAVTTLMFSGADGHVKPPANLARG